MVTSGLSVSFLSIIPIELGLNTIYVQTQLFAFRGSLSHIKCKLSCEGVKFL